MSQAVAGHGALIAIELDPSGSPGVFTTISELNGDITWPELERPWTETTPHQDDIDDGVAGRLGRGPLSFSTNFIFDDSTHDHLTGLYQKIKDNELFGIRMRGPGGTTNTDEWIASGHVINIAQTSPVREGVRTCDVTIRLRKQMIVDGVSIGTSL